jgi:polyphenol oxidase
MSKRYSPTRRELIVGSLLVGATFLGQRRTMAQGLPLHCVPPLPTGAPTMFAPNTADVLRVRKSIFDLDPTELSRLQAAYSALRALHQQKPDDPRGWLHQGIMHCWYCSGAVDAINGQEIHGGWWFLPWHRAYLYFHEKILGELIGDPSFALPYWDWDTPGRNRIADAYLSPADPSNPLYDSTRVATAQDRLPDFLVGKKVMQTILSESVFDGFGGAGEGASGQMGGVEGAPHGGVHLWVTDPVNIDSNNPQLNMGVLGTAAFDPLFYAHHANIDRLWDVWRGQPTSSGNPPDKVWHDQQFYVYDQKSRWTAIAVAQVLQDEPTLRYTYQPPKAPIEVAALTLLRKSVATVPFLSEISGPSIIELSKTAESKPLTPDPTTVQIELPAATRSKLLALIVPSTPGRLVLRIDQIEVPADRGALINVYINRPDATAETGSADPAFVGSIVLVPATARGGHAHRSVIRNFAFDVTQQLAASLPNVGNLSVTLVPFQGRGAKPAEVMVRYRRIYLQAQ